MWVLEFRDLLATIYASFGVIGIEWLLYMCPLELKGARSFKLPKKLCTSTYGA
jgi:hypothetical protein